MSKNLQYTIETLAIEFNRGIEQIKLALDVFMELEMLELTEGNVYRVKNFAKHQNIKVKERIKSIDEEVKSKEIVVEEVLKNEICDNEDKDFENRIIQNEVEVVKIEDIGNLESTSCSINEVDNMGKGQTNNNGKDSIPILWETKGNKTINKKKKKDKIYNMNEEGEAEDEDEDIVSIYDGERPLGKDEKVIFKWFF